MDQPGPKSPASFDHAPVATDAAQQAGAGHQLQASPDPVDLLADCGDSSIYVVMVRCLSEGCYTGSSAMALLATLFMQVTLLALLLSAGRLDASEAPAASADPLQLGDVHLVEAQLRVLQLAACATQQTLLQALQGLDNTSAAADALLPALRLPGCEGLLAAHNITANLPNSSGNGTSGEAAGWANSTFISQTYVALKSGASSGSSAPPNSLHRLVSAVLSRLFPGAGNNAVVTFFAVSMALGILAIFVLREAQQACQLALVAAVLLGCAPTAWIKAAGVSSSSSDGGSRHAAGTDGAAGDDQGGAAFVATRLRSASAWARLAAVLVPLLQMAMSLLTFATAALLMTWVSYSEAVIDIVINSVALGFIIDLDDVMGALIAPALARHIAAHPLPGSTAGNGSGCCYAVGPAKGGMRGWSWLLQVAVGGAMAALVFAVLFAPVLVMLVSMVPLVPVPVLATTAAVHFAFIFFFGINLINLAPLHPLVDQSNKLQLACVAGYIAAVAVASAVTVLAFLLSPGRLSGSRDQPSPQAPEGPQPECRNVTYCDPPDTAGNDSAPGSCYNVTDCPGGGAQAGRPGMSQLVGIALAAVLGVLLLVAALAWAVWAWLRGPPRSRGVGDDGGRDGSARCPADLPAEACDD